MPPSSRWIPLILTLTVLPGMGHWYLKKRLKGILLMGLSLILLLGAIARFFSVLFALANVRETQRPPNLQPLTLVLETLRLDYPVLLSFLALLLAVWALSIIDMIWILKEGK